MFFPTADASLAAGTYNYTDHVFEYPTNTMFQPTIKIIFMQPYFLVMKAIAYMIFVIAIGRIFELSIYTLFAPLPLATFAGEGSHDIAKNFIKTYIATVMQITVMIAMFAIYLAMNSYLTTTAPFAGTPLIQFIVLISLGLGVTKSGTWARRICGAA
jgi:small-conductance mechanosensitive channel